MEGRVFLIVCLAAAAVPVVLTQITLGQGDDKAKVQCTNDSVCSDQFGDMAICDSEYCDCKNNSHFDVAAEKCIEDTTSFRSGSASNKCVTDHDCHSMEDARCHFGNCTCGEDSMESADKTKCLQLAKEVGWGCEEDIQCTSKLGRTTECNKFSCVCVSGTMNHNGACVVSNGLEISCTSDDVCTTQHSECTGGVCRCEDGYVIDVMSTRCLEVAQGFKSPCEESIQCTEVFGQHAFCSKKECICTGNHHFSDMRCWEDKGLTARCDRPDECYIAQDGANQKLQCIAGQCICKPEYMADLSTLTCSGAATATISGLSLALLAVLLVA